MARRAEIQPVQTNKGWMVSTPESMSPDGKRKRSYFATKGAAERAATDLRESYHRGDRRSVLPALVAIQATEALRILEPSGLTLIEAARIAAAQAGNAASMDTFADRYDQTMTIGETIWSDRYVRDMGKIPEWVGAEVMASRCATLSRESLKASIEANGTKNAKTVAIKLRMALAILNNRERGVAKRGPISILTPSQAGRVLRVCERIEERRVVALLLFAGIRPDVEFGEIGRLEWCAVGASEIYIDHSVSKTPSDRHIPITPRLGRLIKGHPKDGLVIPSGWKKTWQRIRRDSGIAEMQDVCRHTFASNFLAAYGEHSAKQAMGHSANSQTLFRHYRRAVNEAAGRKYFR